jgi:hypothetical protein
MKKKRLPSLTFCIILDCAGCISYLLPFFGEAEDLLWAPISGIIFYFLFGRKFGVMGGIFSFLEEISPGFDFIPTFTIAWFIRKHEIEKPSASRTGIRRLFRFQ